MAEQSRHEEHHLSDPAPLIMAAFALPLFIWSAFNADFFDLRDENFVIPLAVFFGGPVALIAGILAYSRRDGYLATVAGLFGAFWLTYGVMLWLMHEGVVSATGDMRGLLFVGWGGLYGMLWIASIRAHWTLGLVTLGVTVMFALLAIGYYSEETNALQAGGYVGFITSFLAAYSALAEMVNSEREQPVLPTDLGSLRRLILGAR